MSYIFRIILLKIREILNFPSEDVKCYNLLHYKDDVSNYLNLLILLSCVALNHFDLNYTKIAISYILFRFIIVKIIP